jgi:hypothetical protein
VRRWFDAVGLMQLGLMQLGLVLSILSSVIRILLLLLLLPHLSLKDVVLRLKDSTTITEVES